MPIMGWSSDYRHFLVPERQAYMAEKELTAEEKARIMHNHYQREWAKKNKDKLRASRIKCLAKKYDQMMAEKAGDGDE